jgi:ribosomal-protein-serine acetyltransferase
VNNNKLDNLKTDEVLLSPYKEEDAQELWRLVLKNKERLLESFPVLVSGTTTLEATEEFIRTHIKEFSERKSFFHTIQEKKSNTLIGHFAVKNIDWSVPKASFAYWIDEEYEGKGLMSAAFNQALNFAFNEAGIHKLYLRINPFNQRSSLIAKKFGFVKEGYLKDDVRLGTGVLSDLIYYGLTKEAFKKRE